MLDKYSIKIIHHPLALTAKILNKCHITANQVTIFGFIIGCGAFIALTMQLYMVALIGIAINRICDGIDGALARIQGLSDAGGFLDISLDFLFYSMIPLGFIIANPESNAIAGAFLMLSFIGTCSSFLAFAAIAAKHNIENPTYKNKSLYYISGLTEGTETIFCFVLFCLYPQYFMYLAFGFGCACYITTFTRIYFGFKQLKQTIG